jgi:glycolate oxidase FAD binding subunit
MSNDTDIANDLAARVRDAAARRAPLAIRGGGSKRFYAGEPQGEPLDVTGHRGIVSHEPTELVITARAGTPLAEIETALAEKDQMLGFEPPHFGNNATLGGAIACGLSGPRRPYTGSARDFVLGVKIINGKGEILKFGGQVMKNVAGFDLSRLMVGAFGTLGVLLEVSLKVLPRPAREITLALEMDAAGAIAKMNTWAAQPLPLSAAAHVGDTLYVRLSGSESGLRAAQIRLGGEAVRDGDEFWRKLREHELGFFGGDTPLWRLSVPPATEPMTFDGKWLLDWGGAQRWLKTDATAEHVEGTVRAAGGHATLFRGEQPRALVFTLTPSLLALHRALRQSFDPSRILNVELLPFAA